MWLESLLAAVVLAAASLPLARPALRRRPAALRALAGGAWIGSCALVGWGALHLRGVEAGPPPAHRPIEVPADGYVTSDTCRACHPREYSTWHRSYHRTMTQAAAEAAVLGDFDDVEVEAYGVRYRLTREGDAHFVELPDPNWQGLPSRRPRIRRRVVQTTGSHHYQVYWTEHGQSRRLALLPIAWRVDEGRWIPRSDAFLKPPTDASPPDELDRWNHTCLKCHTTHGRPRWYPRDGAEPPGYDTHVAEFGIGCESCHGPAEQHVAANRSPARRYARHLGGGPDPTVVQPERLDPERATQVCGQCHGMTFLKIEGHGGGQHSSADAIPPEAWEWSRNGFSYRPGDDLLESRFLLTGATPRDHPVWEQLGAEADSPEKRFWPDGKTRVRGREYNDLLETACFTRGALSCGSCHAMHPPADDPRSLEEWANDQLHAFADSNRPGAHTDEACLQCHADYRDRVAAHAHHPARSEGARCYNCHMPHTTYGLLGAIRSHHVDSPDVRTTVATGRPNACNLCHLDRTLAWTARHLEEWYGTTAPELDERQRTVAAAVLWTVAGDAGQRALVAWSMGWEPAREASGDGWLPFFLAPLLDDPYAAVRFIAHRALRATPGLEGLAYDYVGPRGERRRAARDVLRAWLARRDPSETPRDPALLLDESGALGAAAYEELLSDRDDRPVSFTE